jgi:DNA invertase Pin-like site-specific DNA recombinase
MAVYGYARVSTEEQDLEIQMEALRNAGCSVIRAEKKSGTSTEGREELELILQFAQAGDVLTVTRIDRLARSLVDLSTIVKRLADKGVDLRATEQPVDTTTASGKAFLGMLGVFAEFETNIRRERQMEGVAKAKQAGVYKGRPANVDRQKRIAALIVAKTPWSEIMKIEGCARATVAAVNAKVKAAA